jgi:hypothetical protein
MLEPLRHFLKNPQATVPEALGILRLIFLLMFMAQFVVATLLALALGLIFGPGKNSSPLLSQILILLSLMQLPLALAIPQLSARAGGKQAALAATIMVAVFLSVPAYFASFALLTGTSLPYLMILLALLMTFYALGLFMVNGFAKLAVKGSGQPPAVNSQNSETSNQ